MQTHATTGRKARIGDLVTTTRHGTLGLVIDVDEPTQLATIQYDDFTLFEYGLAQLCVVNEPPSTR